MLQDVASSEITMATLDLQLYRLASVGTGIDRIITDMKVKSAVPQGLWKLRVRP